MDTVSQIVELRQYTLHSGKREVLIDLFDQEFIESQELLGMSVIGQFRDVDDPDRFVWLRGFTDMSARAEGLRAFYDGPVWKAHREVANSTMIDSDDVLLLHPWSPASGLSYRTNDRSPRGTHGHGRGFVVATVCSLKASAPSDFACYFFGIVEPALVEAGAVLLGAYVTEQTPNNFPPLPIRENEEVFVWFAGFADVPSEVDGTAEHAALERLAADAPGLACRPRLLRLTPTARSLMTGGASAGK